MTQNKFSRPTISAAEKEKKAVEFLGFMDKGGNEKTKERTTEKEITHLFSFRIPISLFDDMKEISALSGISLNAVCLEAIRLCIKKKLKELKEED